MSHVIISGRPWDRLIWGLVLIGVGVCFLLSMYGLLPHHFLGTWWPLFVVAAGVGSILCARTPRRIGSAVPLLGIGGGGPGGGGRGGLGGRGPGAPRRPGRGAAP